MNATLSKGHEYTMQADYIRILPLIRRGELNIVRSRCTPLLRSVLIMEIAFPQTHLRMPISDPLPSAHLHSFYFLYIVDRQAGRQAEAFMYTPALLLI